MSVGGVVKHGLEIGGAGGEDHLVGFHVEAFTGDSDIDEGLMVEEILKDGQEVVLVVVPSETVLLGLRGGDCHGDRTRTGSCVPGMEGGARVRRTMPSVVYRNLQQKQKHEGWINCTTVIHVILRVSILVLAGNIINLRYTLIELKRE